MDNPSFEPETKAEEDQDRNSITDQESETSLKRSQATELQDVQSSEVLKNNTTVQNNLTNIELNQITININQPSNNATSSNVQDDVRHRDSIVSSLSSSASTLHRMKTDGVIHRKLRNGIKKYISKTIAILVLLLYVAYFFAVAAIISDAERHWNYWCDADGFLFIMTVLVATFFIYFQIVKNFFGKQIYKAVLKPGKQKFDKVWALVAVKVIFFICIVAGLVTFLIIDTADDRERLISLTGFAFILVIGFLLSPYKRKIVWRHVMWGLAIQFTLALISLRWPLGRDTFDCVSNKVATFIKYTDSGSGFVFGTLVDDGIFAFSILPVILFFSFCISILYYYGVMQWIVIKLGWLLQVTVGTTACESVNAAANIFLGQTEAPLLIRPFLEDMTLSELHAVMTGGYATIAGAVMATYMSLGVEPKHLLTASIMNAPTALAFSKLMYPETQKSKTSTGTINIPKSTEINVLHAAVNGVTAAIPLAANVGANLIAFIAFIHFFNGVFDWSCQLVNFEEGTCTLENIFGYIFMPLAWMMGVAWDECRTVGSLIGIKTFVNEFVAYSSLSELIKSGKISARAQTIATYALCGFSNVGSIGMQMGALSGLCPSRSPDLSTVAARAMVAGSLVCFLSACVAGALTPFETNSIANTTTTLIINTTTESSFI